MEEGTELEPLQLPWLEPELDADPEGEVRDPARVRGRVLVVRLERVRQRLDGGDECPLERLVARGALQGELRLLREAAEQIELSLPVCQLRRDRRRDDAVASVDDERCHCEPAVQIRGRRSDRRVVGGLEEVRLRARQPLLGRAGRNRHERIRLGGIARARRDAGEVAAPGILQPERGAWAREDLRGSVDDSPGNLCDALGLGELPGELEQSCRALRLAALCFVQPGVLERDRGVPGEHLHDAEIVLVELVESELRDDDDARRPRSEGERHDQQRLLDLHGACYLLAELTPCSVAHEERLSGVGDVPGDPVSDLDPGELDCRAGLGRGQIASKRNREQVLSVADEDSTVVVVDEEPKLVGDRQADLRDVVESGELAREALEHLQVCDRANVGATGLLLRGPLGRRLVEEKDEPVAARLGSHHRGLRAGDELTGVRGVLGPDGDAGRHRQPSCNVRLELGESLPESLGERERGPHVARRKDDRELLASDSADDVGRPNRRAEDIGHFEEHLVADAMPVDVVDLLEVVEVEHDERDGVVLGRGPDELLPEPIVEGAVVVEAGQRIGRSLMLERCPDVRVVERQGSGISETVGKQELLLGELRVLAHAIDVQGPLQAAARDEGDGDQGLGLDRRSGDEAHPGIEVSLVREHRLAMLDRPPGDPFAERKALAHDLVRPLAPRENRDQLALRLVGFVDVHVLVGDQLGERVCDALQQSVDVLLGEDVVEDLGQPAVRLDRPKRGRRLPRLLRGDEAHLGIGRRLDGRRVRHEK